MDFVYFAAFATLSSTTAYIAWLFIKKLTDVPDEQREYLDEPPALFKLFWYPIRILAFYVEPHIKNKTRKTLERQILQSGYDYVFSASNIVGAQITFSLFFAFIGLLLCDFAGLDWIYGLFFGAFGYVYPLSWMRRKKKERALRFMKELPSFLDILTLCVEAGLTLNNALINAVAKGPAGPTKQEFSRALRDMKGGMRRGEALRKIAHRVDDSSVQNLMSSIVQAENMGMSLGPILRSQAEQKRSERFLRAEKLAMEAPVKMLFPLVAFIFPCTFIVIGFPVYVLIQQAFA